MSAEQEIETQRRDAVKAAMVMKRAFTAERTGLRKKLKNVKDREKAMYDALQRNGVSKAAFEEAEKRACQDQKDLDLFDTEAAEVETWIRDWIEDDKTDAPEEQAGPDEEDDEDDGGEDLTEDGPEDGEPLPPVESAPEPTEAEPIPAVAESELQFEDDPAIPAEAKPTEEPTWDMGEAPAADPRAEEKTRRVAPAAGAGGVNADDIPMPPSQIHDLQAEQRKRQFVDRRERMSAAEYNETVKAGTGQG